MIRTIKVILVQPGLGKSFLRDLKPREFIDFDIGSIRKLTTGNEGDTSERWERQQKTFPALLDLIMLTVESQTIMINDGAFAKFMYEHTPENTKYEFTTYLASNSSNWLFRIQLRDGNSPFAKEMQKNHASWYQGWVNTGNDLGQIVKLKWNQFLSDLL